MKNIILLCTLICLINCKKSNAQQTDVNKVVNKHINKENQKNVTINENVKLIFTDKVQNYWKKPKLIINKDTLSIKGWDDEWGSELDIKISPNKKYIIVDAIITDMPSSENELNTSENYTCQLISIYKSEILDSFQTACDGEWNDNNEWTSNGEIIFLSNENNNSKRLINSTYVAKNCENSRFTIHLENNVYEILDRGKIISKGKINQDKTSNSNIIKLGKIEGSYYKDSIVIQNYGNSINEYNHFVQCDSKYLTFIKK